MKPPSRTTRDPDSYAAWRDAAQRESWKNFSDSDVNGKDVLDFGCGEGPLSLYLAQEKRPASILGIDLDPRAISRANDALLGVHDDVPLKNLKFTLGTINGLPAADESVDTILAFDCMEHLMQPKAIMADWFRVLRPGGKVLIEWFPFKGPFGPHMNSLVPIPWAHVLFGEKALFETAERIYDHPKFVPNHWDLDEHGNKRPNKWTKVRSFREQAYVNELDIKSFNQMVTDIGFRIARQDNCGFGQRGAKHTVGKILMKLPIIDEYFINYTLVELQK